MAEKKQNEARPGFVLALVIGIPVLAYWVFTSPLFK